MMRFETPPAVHGSAEQQTEQLYRYLYRLARQLNMLPTATGNGEDSEALSSLRAKLANTAKDINDAVSTLRKTATTAIKSLDTRQGTAEREIDAAQGEIDALQETLQTLQTNLSALSTRLDTTADEVDEIQSALAQLQTGITTESITLGETQLTEAQLTALLELI